MRTDQTFLCVSCRLRFSPCSACPGCGRTRVADLSSTPARRDAQESLLRRPSRPKQREWIGLASAPSHRGQERRSFLIGAAVLALVLASPWLSVRVLRTSPLVLGGLVLAGLVMWVALKAIASTVWRKRTPFGIALAKAPPRAPHPESRRMRGHVRALSTILSPVQRRECVGFRVIGTSFGGEVDDGGGVAFDLVLDDGNEVVRVDLPDGSLDITVDDAPNDVQLHAEARSFFDSRGLFANLGFMRLSEGLLTDGAAVEVTGLVTDEPVPDGYRDVQRVPTVRDRPKAPLRIRLLP